MGNVIVDFESGGSYAPGYVLASLRNRRLAARVRRHVVSAGGADEETALLTWEDAADTLTPAQYRQLSEWGTVGVRMDAWDALSLWGYDAHELAD